MAEHPTIDGIHHVTLSVSDLDRSVRWYTDVLGFAEKRRVEVNGMTKAMLTRDELLITLTEHGEFAEPGPFNERHAGLDHLVAYARMSEVTGSDHYKKGPVHRSVFRAAQRRRRPAGGFEGANAMAPPLRARPASRSSSPL